MPVIIVFSSVSLSKGRISILLSTFSSISTSLSSFCWRLLIAFLDAGSFTNIDTYITCLFYLFFIGGVTRINTTSGYILVSFTSPDAIPSYTFPFLGIVVSGLPPNLLLYGIMVSFSCAMFDPFVFMLLLLPVSVHRVISILVGFSTFFSMYGIGVLCLGWYQIIQLDRPPLSMCSTKYYIVSAVYFMAR